MVVFMLYNNLQDYPDGEQVGYVISKVGEVPIRMPVEGGIKQVIIKYGEWFALICVSTEAMVVLKRMR